MSPAAPPINGGNVIQKIGHVVLSLYIFLAYSRLAEQKFPSLHIPGLLFLVLLFFLIAPGVLSPLLSHSVGRFYVALNILLFLSVPFSVWRGGSFAFLLSHWWKMFPLFPLVLGLTTGFAESVRLVRTIAAATLVLAVLVVTSGAEVLGRIAMENSRFGDPNFIAMVLLIGVPLWAFFVLRPGASLVTRTAAAAAFLPIMYTLARTGSRGGFVAAATVVLYAFFRSSLKGKIALALLSVALIGIGVFSMGRSIRDRYLTFFTNTQVQDRSLDAAAGSAQSRWHVLMRSIAITAQNPLLGVGVDMFQTAEDGIAVEEGMRKGAWHVTHNMYTQVSSEIGIPALFCFIAVLVGSWRSLSRVEKAASGHSSARAPEIARLAFCIKLSLLSLLGTGAFLSVAYDDLLAVLPALIVALEQAARREGLLPAPAFAGPIALAPPMPIRARRAAAQVQA